MPGLRSAANAGTGVLAGLCLTILAASPLLATDEFHAYLLPDTAAVEIGSTFVIAFTVDSSATQFNAYEATFGWDPEIVSFVDAASGSLMNLPTCPAPWFEILDQTDSTVTISHSLICSGQWVYGPGELSRLTFSADAPGIMPLVIAGNPDRTFLDRGVWIFPGQPLNPQQVVFHDALVIVFDPTTPVPEGSGPEGGDATTPGSIPSRFAPNPTERGGVIEFELPGRGSATIEIFGVRGERIWSRVLDGLGAGWHRVPWDVTRSTPSPGVLTSGVYLYRIRGAGDPGDTGGAGPSRHADHLDATGRIVIAR